jgi:hypothetical protein
MSSSGNAREVTLMRPVVNYGATEARSVVFVNSNEPSAIASGPLPKNIDLKKGPWLAPAAHKKTLAR